MASTRDVEQQATDLESLRTATPDVATASLRKALQQRNNYIVSRAAKLAADLSLPELTPDLAASFA